MIAVGDSVVPLPGVTWCSRDIGGQRLTVVHVEHYPAELGGPVYVCDHTNGPHLQAAQLDPARLPAEQAPGT